MPFSNLKPKSKIETLGPVWTDDAKELRDWKRHVYNSAKNADGSNLLSLLLFVAAKQLDASVSTASPEKLFLVMHDLFKLTEYLSQHKCFACFDKSSFAQSLTMLKAIEEKLSSSLCNRSTLVGDTYQIWSSLERKEVLKRMERADKILSPEELICFTQIYTPEWVVDFLIEETLGKSIAEIDSRVTRDLKILDPACGSGHFLVKAFDYLLRFYDNNPISASKTETVTHILKNQLFGADIDNRSLFTAALHFALRCRSLNIVPSTNLQNFQLLDLDSTEQLGSVSKNLPQDSILQKQYDIVLTNPPYIGRKLISRSMKQRLKEHYPDAFSDLSSAFVRRSLDLINGNGKFGVITQASILSLPTYKKLRRFIFENFEIDLIVDLGPGVFPTQSGEKINSALLVVSQNGFQRTNETIRIIDAKQKPERLAAKEYFVSKLVIEDLYDYCFNYHIPDKLAEAILKTKTLGEFVEIRQGLATTDNKRFLRYIWQIDKAELGTRWFAYAKGAGKSKWYSPIIHVVDWQDDGHRIKESAKTKYPYLKGKVAWVVKNEDFYFRKGLCFSFVNTKGLAIRKLPAGCIFDVGASSIFTDRIDHSFLSGYINSSLVNAFMCSINPTINNQVGDLKRIPIPLDRIAPQYFEQLSDLAQKCYETSQQIYRLTSPTVFFLFHDADIHDPTFNADCDFDEYLCTLKNLTKNLNEYEESIDDLVFQIFEKQENWNESTSKSIRAWANSFKTNRFKDDIYLEYEKNKIQFACMIITKELMDTGVLSKKYQIKIEKLIEKPLHSFLKSEFKTFISSAFYKTVPDKLAALMNKMR